jgi:hypothetical protein
MSFGVHAAQLWYKCYRCNAKGRLRDALDRFESYEPPEVDVSLGVEPPEGFEPLSEEPAASALAYSKPRSYLLCQRGVRSEVVASLGVGACLTGLFRGRIVVPIKDASGTWLWFVGRAWSRSDTRRYKYPLGNRHGVMFNREALNVETSEPVYVVEGVFDALPHYPLCVACLGKPQDTQLAAIAGARRPVVLALDGDAHEEAWAVAMRLRLRRLKHGKIGYTHFPPRKDPGDMKDLTELESYVKWLT